MSTLLTTVSLVPSVAQCNCLLNVAKVPTAILKKYIWKTTWKTTRDEYKNVIDFRNQVQILFFNAEMQLIV